MRGLERRFDAHVTADLTEQWMLVSLPQGMDIDLDAIAEMVPDCGMSLRGVELEALGDLRLASLAADGPALPHLVLSSSGQRLLLAKEPGMLGPVQLFGRFDPPVQSGTPLVVEEALSVVRQ